METNNMKEVRLSTDILIIGGGSAGLWAADRAKEIDSSLDVLIVDKGPADWGGLMSMAGGDFDVILPDEKVDDWVKDLVYYYDGLCDQDLVEALLSQSYARMQDYERLGCRFFKKEDGSYKGIPQRGLPNIKLYPAKYKGKGGEDMVRNLVREVKERGVKRLGRILITDLLKDGEVVAGALGFDTRSGDFYVIEAKAVILATGWTGWKTSYGKNTTTGEGAELAFKAGAKLSNFEFGRVWNVPKLFGWEGQTALFPLGAKMVNALGQPLMDDYSPVLGANTDPHYTTLAMAVEYRKGHGPFYLDISAVNPDDMVLLKPQDGWQKLNYDKLCALGIDMFKENSEWIPQLTCGFGGVEADLDGYTGVPGLYAAGTARSLDPGVYMGGFALETTASGGYMTGQAVAQRLMQSRPQTKLNDEEIGQKKQALYAHIGQGGLEPHDCLRAIQEVLFPYEVSIIKSEQSLTQALDKLHHIQANMLPQMKARDPHYLLKLIEVQGISFISELYLQASLLRKESRAGHFREDYPTRNNEDFLAWIVESQGKQGEICYSKRQVPLETYKHPIERYYSDNFTFSKLFQAN
jgi:succinate dehydrogenase/fumarate reductase flavoprotein subunit